MSLKHLAIAALALVAAPAAAIPGLTVQTWSNLAGSDYYPTSATITQKIAETSALTPNSTYVQNFGSAYFYNYDIPVGGAVRYSGSFNALTAGAYSFQISADDAARLIINGMTVAESNFQGSGLSSPSMVTLDLAAGAHSFELFAFQNVGGQYFEYLAWGPTGFTFDSEMPGTDVPEPAMLGLFGLGIAGLGLARRRRN